MKSETFTTAADFRARAPLGYLVFEVAKLLKRRFEDEAKAHALTLPQWRALAQIGQRPGIAQVALAQAIDADPMTISGVLDRLEKRGLIERYADPTDSRAKLATLTPEGEVLLETSRHVGVAMYLHAIDGIPPPDAAAAESVLRRMRDNLAGQLAETEDVSR